MATATYTPAQSPAPGRATDDPRTPDRSGNPPRSAQMLQRLVIIGAGFAGMHAALASARLRDANGVSSKDLEIALVAPEPTLVVRPRPYEPDPETLTAPLGDSSEEPTSELQSLMRTTYAVFCLT